MRTPAILLLLCASALADDPWLMADFVSPLGSSTKIFDRSNYKAHAIASNTPACNGRAYLFDGNSAFVNYTTTNLTTVQKWTVTAWINPTNASGHQCVFSECYNVAGLRGIYCTVIDTGSGFRTLASVQTPGAYIQRGGDVTISLNTWSFCTWSYDASGSLTGISETVNGVVCGTGYTDSSGVLTASTGNGGLSIGCRSSSDTTDLYFKGRIDGVRVYSRQLSLQEILAIYAAGRPGA